MGLAGGERTTSGRHSRRQRVRERQAAELFLEEHRRKRQGAELELGEEDHHLLQFQDWSVKESNTRRRNIHKEELEEVEA